MVAPSFPITPTSCLQKGTLWYLGTDNHWRELMTNSYFWFIQQEKRNLVMRGFDKERFKITY